MAGDKQAEARAGERSVIMKDIAQLAAKDYQHGRGIHNAWFRGNLQTYIIVNGKSRFGMDCIIITVWRNFMTTNNGMDPVFTGWSGEGKKPLMPILANFWVAL